MMRKIGLNRPSRLGLGPKKVAPPQVPGGEGLRRISGVYSESGLPPGVDAFNSSFDSFTSEVPGAAGSDGGSFPSCPSSEQGSIYGEARGPAPCRPDSLYVGHPLPPPPQEVAMPAGHFKEPYVPYRSSSTVSSPTQDASSPTKGSRNSMSSIDSGWASNPVPGFSSFCSRASNSSLNSDKTSFSNEELETRPIVHQQHHGQRRMSTISNGPPPPKRQSSTSSFTSQPPVRNCLRPAGSQVRPT